jgi:protein phosphatase
MDSHGLSHIGKVRAVNDDQFMIADLRRSMFIHQTSVLLGEQSPLFGDTLGQLLLVADGGGRTADTQASTITIRTIIHYMLTMMPWFYRLGGQQEDEFLHELESALAKCQERVQAVADTTTTPQEMGAALTMAYVIWPRLYVIHVGNSRCYLQRGAMLEQITTDHTLAQQLVEDGVLPAYESTTSRLSSILWNAIGGGLDDLDPEVHKATLQVGDTLLLCTDGLPKHVADKDINSLLQARESSQEICRNLVDAANSAGGTDNITVIVARFLQMTHEPAAAVEVAANSEMATANGLQTEPAVQPVPAGVGAES